MSKLRNTAWVCAGLGLLFPLTPAAQADFVVTGSSSQSSAAAPVAMAPIVDPGDRAAARSRAHGKGSPSFHWKVANGFGNQVPLGFACRQIVPPAVHVTYGPGASPDMLVSWKGGNTWNRVLYDAVAPLGLRLVMTHMAVEIRK